MREPAYWREYRAARKALGRPIKRDEAAYRAARKAAGKPVTHTHRVPKPRTFVAWDGEGVTDPSGAHRYTMLANSRGDVIEGHDLSTVACFDALLDGAAKYPNAVHVIFGGTYDATKWLRDLTRERATAVVRNTTLNPVWVTLGGRLYAIEYRPRKMIRISRFRDAARRFVRDEKGKSRPDYDAKITVWDVIGFFQSTFVKAGLAYGVQADWKTISAMKEKRGTFEDADAANIRAYCVAECVALEKLMQQLQQNLRDAGLYPSRWDGAGAVAAALLRREGVKAHIAQEPPHLERPIECAFFGGRIELCQVGTTKNPLFNYDIASAYPAGAEELPSLRGEWKKSPATVVGGFAVSFVRWDFSDVDSPWYPLPYRNPDGTIMFPAQGAGWYWTPEVAAAIAWAQRHGGSLAVEHRWVLHPDDPAARPFAFIPPLFLARQVLKEQGQGAQMAIKLALNSLYGKTAQQLGGSPGKPPPFFALAWAGFITSTARARLVMAAIADPGAIVAFATDGIYSTRALPIESTPQERKPGDYIALGAWEGPTTYAGGVFVAAGVYWLAKHSGAWEARYRGFDRDTMANPERVWRAWRKRLREVAIETTRFVALTEGVCGDRAWSIRGTWRTAPRTLRIDGHSPKRYNADVRGLASRLRRLEPRANDAWEALHPRGSFPYRVDFRPALVDGITERAFDEGSEELYV